MKRWHTLSAGTILVSIWLAGCFGRCSTGGTVPVIPTSRPIDLSSFHFLALGTSFEEITERVGIPHRDIGSGVYLFQYDLTDGRRLTLQFIIKDELSGIWIVDGSGEWHTWAPGD